MVKDTVKIGLIGLGTIGSGVAALLKQNSETINSRLKLNLVLQRAADQDRSKIKALDLDPHSFTTSADELIDDPHIDIIVELIGGIEPARTLISAALKKGKYVVTANKDLMAGYGVELLTLARENKRNIFYEASVGGAIPIIRPLKESFIADRIKRIVGIVNGTTNYILTRMDQDSLSLDEALHEAKMHGFAEPVPTNDIEGLDAAYKLVILAGLAFGRRVAMDDLYIRGISDVTREDIIYAREIGCAVKLLAIAEDLPEGLALRVHPTLLSLNHPLASVSNEFNAICVEGEAAGEIMFYGRGAGAGPTATAVLADVCEAASAIGRQIDCGVMERVEGEKEVLPLERLNSRFYLRFLAEDRPGVFASLANVFGGEKVSLDMVIQKRRVSDTAEIVLVTHMVAEEAFQKALNGVMTLPVIRPNPSVIRLLN